MNWILDIVCVLAMLTFELVPKTDPGPSSGIEYQPGTKTGSYSSTLYGFRVEAPGKDWNVQTISDGPTGGVVVAITRKDGSQEVSASVKADFVSAPLTAKQARERDLAFVKDKDAFGPPRIYELRVAGVDSSALDIVYTSPEKKSYRVRKVHIVHDGVHYAIEASMPETEFAAHEKEVERIFDSFAFVPVPRSESAKRRWLALAAKCGSEIEWVEGWEQAAAKARAEKRPVLVSVNLREGFAIADEAMTSTFMDEDVVELVRERCVCMQMGPQTEAPFRSQSSYGIGPLGFGVALLFVSPEGVVLEEEECQVPQAVYDFLRRSLALHPELAGNAVDGAAADAHGVEAAELHARRGELERALACLEGETSAHAQLVRARCQRRLAAGEPALAALDLARAAGDAASQKAAIECERGIVLLRLGRIADAKEAFDRSIAADPACTSAMYWRGACAYYLGKDSEARSAWEKLAEKHPKDRWAWAAAAEITGPKMEVGLRWNPRWVSPEHLRVLRKCAPEVWPSARAREAAEAAVRFLVREQHADGSWSSPEDVRDYDMPRPDPFADAITALAGEALLHHLDLPDAQAAVDRARVYLFDSIARAKRSPDNQGYMDYEVWSRPCMLRFFAECIDQKQEKRDEMREASKWLVTELRHRQRTGGGWSYYLTSDLTAGNVTDQQSISFVTAGVTQSLQRARKSGLADATGLIDGGLTCLQRLRGEDGVFEYMIGPQAKAPAQSPTPAGAAGRGPACELALLEGKRSDLERLRGALSSFRAHADALAHERGKVLMHCGPEGQGCHYILFDYWTAALAVRELPEKERALYRVLLTDRVLQLRSEEGGFRDTPILGWDCGTALALLTLDALEP